MSAISQSQILAGKAIACFVTTVGVCFFMVIVAVLVFKVEPTSYPLLALSIVSVAAGFVGILMLLSVLGRTERSAAGIGWAIMTVMAMIGGGMVPSFIMPPWMQSLGAISPVYWAINALEGPIWRGAAVSGVLFPCGVLLAIGVVCFTLGAAVFSVAEKR